MLPYEPAILLDDQQVGVLSFHTLRNPSTDYSNVDLNSRAVDMQDSSNHLLQELIELKPQMGWAIKKFLDERKMRLRTSRR
jgi:hypothetical protein